MTLLPLYDRVIVRRGAKAKETEGGILIYHRREETQNTGVVVAINSRTSPEIQVSREVVFDQGAGKDLIHEGQKLLVLKEEEIAAVLEP